MRLTVSLKQARMPVRDIEVTVDVTATIGEVARRLLAGIESSLDPAEVTLRVEHPGRLQARILDPASPVHESSLRSGCTIEVISTNDRRPGDDYYVSPLAIARVLSGPHAGASFSLNAGVNLIGRDDSANVHLIHDPDVSPRHATITIDDTVTIADLNSVNGLYLGERLVNRATIGDDSRVTIGRSILQIGRLPGRAALGHDAVAAFSRSPRVEPVFAGKTFALPEPPSPPEKPRFPMLAVISPVILGAVLFAVTRQPFTLLFIAMSPVMMLGTWIDQRTQGRRKQTTQRSAFEASMMDVRGRLIDERRREVAARARESPAITHIVDAVIAGSSLLWTRKPEHRTFLDVRFGTGTLASRTTTTMPTTNAGAVADWNRALELATEFATVRGVPVVENLERAGSLGIAGTTAQAADAARSVVLQLAGLHSPADLAVAAFAGGESTDAWGWLNWLPHVNSAYSPLRANGLAAGEHDGIALLAELEGLVAARRAAGSGRGAQVRSRLGARGLDASGTASIDRLPATPAVVVIVTAQPNVDRARLVALAEDGPDLGVFLLWVAPSQQALPVTCRTYVSVDDATGRAVVGFVRAGHEVELESIDLIDPIEATTTARALAPLSDDGARVLDETDLPASVGFAGLYGADVLSDPDCIVHRWVGNDSITRDWIPGIAREPGGMAAIVGQGSEQPVSLDLRAHGPHALVGGTTGSGKSEFLQTWIMGMATEYSPDRLTFLLVDYKGGAAFADCVDLPHTVGLVTDLSPHLVRRALTSLRAELKHRETLLNTKAAKDLETLERRSDPDAPPALVIVVDEFAALASEVPEFVDGVVDIAQRGRSLGLHLVLATQRPSGVIKDSLRANTNLRVALRVADEADSTDVLGVDVAAAFDPRVPGRAAAKLGPGRVVDFQTAHIGGRTRDAPTASEILVRELPFGPGAPWPTGSEDAPGAVGPRDIERLADAISRAADSRCLDIPRRPWLDQLPAVVALDSLPSGGGSTIAVGIIDEPEAQRQRPFELDFDTGGNVAVFGAGGAGKSAALRTVAAAASRVAVAYPVAIYGVDFAGSGLASLAVLPTVGAIIDSGDKERLLRLVKDLSDESASRALRYSAAKAANLQEYRAVSGVADPRILVLVDGMSAFRSEYEFHGAGDLFDRFTALVANGRQLGIHFVFAADRSGAFPSAMLANVGRRIVLRLAGETEYAVLGVAGDALDDAPPGRALAGSHELQFAVPGASLDLRAQSDAIAMLASALERDGVAAAPPVERLGTLIAASTLPREVNGRPTIGVSDETLEPVGLPMDGLFVVSGPFGSGRTTTMMTAVTAIRVSRPQLAAYLLAARGSELEAVTGWTGSASDADDAETLARELAEALERPGGQRDVDLFIVIESVGDFEGLPAEGAIVRLLKAARRAGVVVLAETDTVTGSSAWQIFAELKTARAGIVLQPNDTDGLALFRTPFPRTTRNEFPVGRGILVDAGRIARVHVAMPD